MIARMMTLLLLPLMLSGSPQQVTAPPLGLTVDGRVVNVVDGDTLDAQVAIVVRLRLLDCWAPESRTRDAAEKVRGLAAKDRMVELAQDQPVRIWIPGSGSFSDVLTMERVLARAWLIDSNGRPQRADLSGIMVSEGHATKTKGGK